MDKKMISRRLKKTGAIFLALAMIVTFIPMMGRAAYAADGTSIVARNSTLDLTSTELNYRAKDGSTKTVDMTQNDVNDSAEGWSWNAVTHTLTLSGCDITGDMGGNVGGVTSRAVCAGINKGMMDVTITLAEGTHSKVKGGTNKAPEGVKPLYSAGIAGYLSNDAGLTINGSGSLTIDTQDIIDYQTFAYGIYNGGGTVRITGDAVVTVGTGAATADGGGAGTDGIHVSRYNSNGIEHIGDIVIDGNTKVFVEPGKVSTLQDTKIANSHGIGCEHGYVRIGGNASVTAIGGKASVNDYLPGNSLSTGILAPGIEISDNADVTAVGGTSTTPGGDAVSHGITVYPGNNCSLAVSGEAVLKATGGLTGITDMYGSVGQSKGTLTVSDEANVTAYGLTRGGISITGAVNYNGGTLIAKTGSDETIYYAYYYYPLSSCSTPIIGEGIVTDVYAGADENSAVLVDTPDDSTYKGNKYVRIEQIRQDIYAATVTGITDKTYTGDALTQSPVITLGEVALTEGTDYTISYEDNMNAGTAKIIIKGKGNYSGKITRTFTISPIIMNKPVFPKTSYTYTGSKIELGQPTGFDDKFMTIDPLSPTGTNAGKYNVTIGLKDKVNYQWSDDTTDDFIVNWIISKVSSVITISTAAVTKTGSVSKAITFTRAAKATSGSVKYSDNCKYASVNGAGKVTIKKNFTGAFKVTASSPEVTNYMAAAKSYTVKVKPGKMAVKKAVNVKGTKIKATWTKMTGADKYQVRVAQNSKMTKGKKTYTIKGSAASKTTGKLVKGKTYYVQIRAYDTQTKSWGAWSAKKKVKRSK